MTADSFVTVIWAVLSLLLWLCLVYACWAKVFYRAPYRLQLEGQEVLWVALAVALCLATSAAVAYTLARASPIREVPGHLEPCSVYALIGLCTVTTSAVSLMWLKRTYVEWRLRDPQPRCRRCGYVLRGITVRRGMVRCPECGYENSEHEVMGRYRKLKVDQRAFTQSQAKINRVTSGWGRPWVAVLTTAVGLLPLAALLAVLMFPGQLAKGTIQAESLLCFAVGVVCLLTGYAKQRRAANWATLHPSMRFGIGLTAIALGIAGLLACW